MVLAALCLAVGPVLNHAASKQAELLSDGAYAPSLMQRVREAKRRIICAFYLFKVGDRRDNLPAAVVRELVQARKRGVDVTVILDGSREVRRENLSAAGPLSRGGVRVVIPTGRRVNHLKAVVIDDRYVTIGSHNLTHAALERNRELSVFLDSPELAAEVTRYLEAIR